MKRWDGVNSWKKRTTVIDNTKYKCVLVITSVFRCFGVFW